MYNVIPVENTVAKKSYIYFLTDKDSIVTDRFDVSVKPEKGATITDYYGKEYLVKQLIPSSEIDSTSHVLIESIDD